ncbi:MAG TPA: polyketide synthase, partial [Longimicrobiales bacterium]|nr:polyketide synthase [Longimicrobiales bacterium]
MTVSSDEDLFGRIAVVGMAGRFPGAASVDELWDNLVSGVESIRVFTDAELADEGISPDLIRDPSYVKARGLVEAPEEFDAAFFGIRPREAELMDPQHRLFLETCWHALENAGYPPAGGTSRVGVWGGMSTGMANDTYLHSNLGGPGGVPESDVLPTLLGNENDYLTTRVSYKLDLRGPSVNVQTACSTSLVAIVQAFQSLMTWECDVALAGGVSVSYPQRAGYVHQEGGIGSPDGHCRPFDAEARGTVFSNGVGVVVLKRLEDALEDGDRVLAVVRGAASNND